MKFTLSWLKAHLDTDATLDQILVALTELGLEVEGVEDKSKDLAPFKVAHVRAAEQHPNADRLRVCTVDAGDEVFTVVCGAPNARAGLKVVFARSGSTIPRTGAVLKPAEIRGVPSSGMMCSAYEMGLSEDHDGIIELPEDAEIGTPFAQILGLDDPVIEIAVTPNRADCLGVHGVARDLAAKGLGRLKPVETVKIAGAFPQTTPITIAEDARKGCPIFTGRIIRGVKNGPSPEWIQRYLRAVGLRPISTLVDVTNLFCLGLNRPLHVFDLAKLKGGLNLRLSPGGESFEALTGKTVEIPAGAVVIDDATGPVSLAGIVGGVSTSCDETTTDVLLESAWFDPLTIARAGRAAGVHSDARFRFERGVDPGFVIDGAELAPKLILELCGGEASELLVVGDAPDVTRSLTLRPERVGALGGVPTEAADCARILTALGCAVTEQNGLLAVKTPSWRADIEGEADLVEEVLRVRGYDLIPETPMDRPTAPPPPFDAKGRRVARMRRLLAQRGLMEAVTWSFLAKADAERFGGGAPELTLANPISADLDQMRPTPLPNLLAAAQRNRARGLDDVALFECGPGYVGVAPTDQQALCVGLRVGGAAARHWRDGVRGVDAFDAKADLLAALSALGVEAESLPVHRDAPDFLHPGRSGVIKLGPKTVLGWFGEVHPSVAASYDLDAPAVAFQIFLDAVPAPKKKAGRARPLLKPSAFQPVKRDFAFVMDRDKAADALVKAVRGADKGLISDVTVFDLYQGDKLPADKKSVAVAVTLQPTDRTLTDAEIDAVAGAISAAAAKAVGAELRG